MTIFCQLFLGHASDMVVIKTNEQMVETKKQNRITRMQKVLITFTKKNLDEANSKIQISENLDYISPLYGNVVKRNVQNEDIFFIGTCHQPLKIMIEYFE